MQLRDILQVMLKISVHKWHWKWHNKNYSHISHSVESPSMVDSQWNIWHWGSKWNLHTVCWDGVGCQWGTSSVYFGITYVCFIPSRLPVFAVEPQYRHQDFSYLSKLSFEGHIKNLYWLSCECLPFEVFFSCLCDVTYANMLVTTQWPLKCAAHPASLVWVCVVWWPESLMELSTLWRWSWVHFVRTMQNT